MRNTRNRGYTLVELIVAVGLFALVMLLASGAYLMMIGLNAHAQSVATGIDNLSFAIETMTRSIRTGSTYNCGGLGDCPGGANSFSFKNVSGVSVSYSLSASAIQETISGSTRSLTDPTVTISTLTFYVSGTGEPPTDLQQPHVTIIIAGTVSYGAGKTDSFSIETGATMRGSDIGGFAPVVPPPGECGSGGTLVESSGYCIHTFIANGAFTPPSFVSSVEVLVVAGGAGAGGDGSGGAGAGGVVYHPSYAVQALQNYTVLIGDGGTAHRVNPQPGDNSVFDTITAVGGGPASDSLYHGSRDGGSGGGGSNGDGPGSSIQGNSGGGTGFGHAGGYTNTGDEGGGGGGAGAVGGNTIGGSQGGAGGIGYLSSISGVATYYAGGGGGGGTPPNATGGIGGLGGGGNGGAGAGSNATPNTGGGGGGAGSGDINGPGGNGGSGIVIVRYVKP